MPPEPDPAAPGWDDYPAWLDQDPMTAEEREAWLDHLCELDEPPEEEEFGDFDPLTPGELAEIREAAADEMLAAGAAMAGRRGPGMPGSARIFSGESASPAAAENCRHPYQANGHDPGVKLRHLSEVRHATCTSPVCRRPAAACDFEHNIPYEAGGRSCLCNGGPKCRHDHRLKQHPRWHVDQLPDATFRWTTPSGRTYTTEPTRYPI
jgi:hypothetical protein